MDDHPKEDADFSTWCIRWTRLVQHTEKTRGEHIEDDIKCSVVLRHAPPLLHHHLVIKTSEVTDRFSSMDKIITRCASMGNIIST